MTTTSSAGAVGRIVESTLEAFEAECLEGCVPPPLGALLATLDGEPTVYAAVTSIHTAGIDPSRPVVPHGGPDEDLETVLLRNPHLPLLLRVSFEAAIIGYADAASTHHRLPAAPPPLLARVNICDADDTARFTEGFAFLEPLTGTGSEHDEMVAAFLRRAADAAGDRQSFLLAAGRRLVPLLSPEPERLVAILRRIRSV